MKLSWKVVRILFWYRSFSCLNCSERMQTTKSNLSGKIIFVLKLTNVDFSNEFDSSCLVTTVVIRVYLF